MPTYHINRSPLEDKKLSQSEVDHQGDENIGAEGEGGGHSIMADQVSHQRAANECADPGDEIEKQDFQHAIVPPGFEYPEDIDEIRGQIGKDEGDHVANDRIAHTDGV